MIRYIIILLFLFNQSKVFSQSILSNKPKYQVKEIIPKLGYEAIFTLENGDKETKKSVKLKLFTGNLTTTELENLLDIKPYIELNRKAKERCKNPYSWKPREIEITKTWDGTIVAKIYGSAENSYGARSEAKFWFEYLEGNFYKLDISL